MEPEQFAVFDPSSGDDVELFCRRIQDMAYVKGSVTVCEVLPRCLNNSAMYWYMSLDEVDRTQMRHSTDVWIRLLRERFGISIIEAYDELVSLDYDINTDYDAYYERKIRLARLAGITNKELIIHHLFRGLPFEMRMALACWLEGSDAGNLNLFRRRCRVLRSTLLTKRSNQHLY